MTDGGGADGFVSSSSTEEGRVALNLEPLAASSLGTRGGIEICLGIALAPAGGDCGASSSSLFSLSGANAARPDLPLKIEGDPEGLANIFFVFL